MTICTLQTDTTPAPTDAILTDLLPRLEARARFMTRDTDLAQDLAQEVVLKLWTQTRSGCQIDDVHAYAMTALRNLVASRWRSQVVCEPLEDDSAATLPEAPARLGLAETKAAIARLPKEQADLLRRVAAGETSPAALARATGLPAGTVMSRLSRARARLRAELKLPAENATEALM